VSIFGQTRRQLWDLRMLGGNPYQRLAIERAGNFGKPLRHPRPRRHRIRKRWDLDDLPRNSIILTHDPLSFHCARSVSRTFSYAVIWSMQLLLRQVRPAARR